MQKVAICAAILLLPEKPMLCAPAVFRKEHARLLHRPVRKKQERADFAHVGAGGFRRHALQPIGGNDLGIVVEKEKKLPVCFFGGKVVEARPVERFVHIQNAAAPFRILFQPFFAGFFRFTGIVGDDDLVIFIRRSAVNGIETLFDVILRVAGGNDDGNERLAAQERFRRRIAVLVFTQNGAAAPPRERFPAHGSEQVLRARSPVFEMKERACNVIHASRFRQFQQYVV